jgi:hypothetical protein
MLCFMEVENMLMTEFNIDVAKEVWMEEALQDGIEIGESRGKLETARAMIDYGDPVEKAARITGIPAGELRRCLSGGGTVRACSQCFARLANRFGVRWRDDITRQKQSYLSSANKCKA